MAALVCDICGGKLVMGAGGIATCDSCGMEYNQERLREKVMEIKGVVQVDNSHMISSWMKMGTAAAQAGNYEEAYKYFEKVVEADPENWRAIFEKGKAAAWQSTVNRSRMAELENGVTRALGIIDSIEMSNDERIAIRTEFALAIFDAGLATVELVRNEVREVRTVSPAFFPENEELLKTLRKRKTEFASQLNYALSLISSLTDAQSEKMILKFKETYAETIVGICNFDWIWRSRFYYDYNSGEPVKGSGYYIGLSADEKKPYLDKYCELAYEIRKIKPDYAPGRADLPKPFSPPFSWGLNYGDIENYWKEAERTYRIEREEYERKQAEENKIKSIEKYWAQYLKGREECEVMLPKINSALQDLEEQLRRCDSSIADTENLRLQKVPAECQLEEMEKRKADLLEKEKSLGIFANKEKKQIRKQIDDLQQKTLDLEKLSKHQRENFQNEISEKVATLNSQKTAIVEKITALEIGKNKISAILTENIDRDNSQPT